MKRNALGVFVSLTVLCALFFSGCATKQVSSEQSSALDALSARIAEAEAMGAVDCAPKELARAKAFLDHAWHEVAEHGDDAAPYLKTAEVAIDKLLDKTRPCWEAKQVKPAPELSVSVEPSSITAGSCAKLSWSALNADSVSLEPGSENLALGGTKEVCPPATTLYQLTATGPGGTASASANLEVVETLADVGGQQGMVSFTPIYFDFDRSFIRDDAKPGLQAVAAALKADQALNLVLEGHCDERGTLEYNLALGERRAAAAKRYLQNLGVAASRLTTLSYGEERPADPGHDEAAWAKNRRVEFVGK
jgi:peptidoglycan-associated lipoprotein